MKRSWWAGAGLSLAILASACGGGGGGGAGDSAAPAGQGVTGGTALPMDDQVLVVGALADGYGEVPGRPDMGKYPLNTSVFDTLARMNEDLQVEPMLAERWEVDEASNTFRYFLRRGVKFHDGAELTAEDVKYTFDMIAKANPTNYQTIGPDSVKVVDRYTVTVTPMKKNLRLVEQLVHPVWGINRLGTTEAKPVGTGPYRFVDYVKNDRFVVERFDEHWSTSRAAKAKRITFRFIADPQTKLLALRSGEVDVIMDVPRDAATDLRKAPGLQVITSKVGAFNAINFNIAGVAPHDITKDPLVRQAIAGAIDRKALLDKVWANNAQVSTTWIPPAVLGSEASKVQGAAYEPERSAQLLDQAGWKPGADGIRTKDGRRLSLSHLIQGPGDSDPRDSAAAAEFIQDQLKRIGVETKIELPERAIATSRLNTGQYDLAQGIGNQNEGNPCFLPDLSYYSKSGTPSAKWRTPGGKTDEAIEGCRSVKTVDEVRRSAAEAIHQLVDVERVVVPLIGLQRIWGMKADVSGFTPHPSLTNQRWETVYRVKL